MRQYLDLLDHVRKHGRYKKDRTGTGCFSIYGAQYRVNLADGFPLLTTKKVSLRWVAEELFWFLRGDTSNDSLLAKGVDIWNEWALKEDHFVSEGKSKTITELLKELHTKIGGAYNDARRKFYYQSSVLSDEQFEAWLAEYGISTKHPDNVIPKGTLGPIYGAQWRNFGGVDQITQVLKDLRDRPYSRRHIVTAWNPTVAPDERVSVEQNILNGKAALASCHCFFQFHCTELTREERLTISNGLETEAELDEHQVPKIGLMLQFYQRQLGASCR